MPQPLAVLDACVLVPAVLSDLLLRVAAEDLYQMYWTLDILEEVRRTLQNDLRLTEAQATRRVEAMAAAFPDALITNHSSLIGTMPNHPKDRHVLAAAVASGAQFVVTLNLRDFPTDMLAPLAIAAWSPDTFLGYLFKQHAQGVISALQKQAAALHNPPKTIDDILKALTKYAPIFVTHMREYLRDRSAKTIVDQRSHNVDSGTMWIGEEFIATLLLSLGWILETLRAAHLTAWYHLQENRPQGKLSS